MAEGCCAGGPEKVEADWTVRRTVHVEMGAPWIGREVYPTCIESAEETCTFDVIRTTGG